MYHSLNFMSHILKTLSINELQNKGFSAKNSSKKVFDRPHLDVLEGCFSFGTRRFGGIFFEFLQRNEDFCTNFFNGLKIFVILQAQKQENHDTKSFDGSHYQ